MAVVNNEKTSAIGNFVAIFIVKLPLSEIFVAKFIVKWPITRVFYGHVPVLSG